MASWKRRMQEETEWTLPTDLLLEIVARSDARTLVRSAATSKLLRRGILDPFFINRVTKEEGGIVPGCIVARLNAHRDEADPRPPLSLVYPATAAAGSFLDDHMCPHMSVLADDLLGEHTPVVSRGGLVLFRRRRTSDGLSSLCVHDLITGDRTFLSYPPDIGAKNTRNYVLLTAADGIVCSFLLFFADLYYNLEENDTHIIQAQIATSACPTWAPVAMVHESNGFYKDHGTVILHGGVIHWLLPHRRKIVTYNVNTMEQGTIMLPDHVTNFKGQWSYLGSYHSHDGKKLLRLMIFKEFKIHVWHQLPDGDWTPGTIDMEEKLRSLDPEINTYRLLSIKCKWSGEGSNMVLLGIYWYGSGGSRSGSGRNRTMLIWLDLGTKGMLVQQDSVSTSSMLLEVDLPSRLCAMKLFP